MADIMNPDTQEQAPFGQDAQRNYAASEATSDTRDEEQVQKDNELAERLAAIIEDANKRVVPIVQMIRKNIEGFFEKKEEDRDEGELIKSVKPLIEQGEKVLNETNGAIKGADPDNRLTNRATRHQADHRATPEEQRLAAALKVMIEEVGGTIDWAKGKLNSLPKAKNELGPLLDALGQPLTQIVGGVGLLLAGVLNLVSRLLSGLGLSSLLDGIMTATGLKSITKAAGLDKFLNFT